MPWVRGKPEIMRARIGVDLGVGEEFSISLATKITNSDGCRVCGSDGNYESGSRRPEYDHGIVHGNVDVIGTHRLNFDVVRDVRHAVIRIRAQIAVIVSTPTKPLDSIHYIGTLHQDRIAKLLRPSHILG